MAVAIYALEAFNMIVLSFLPEMPPIYEALADSTLLLALLTPFYLFYYRPFWNEHQEFSKEVSQLSRQLLRTVEDERKRVSHELHDQCGQTLTALQFGFEALRKDMPEDCARSRAQITDLAKLLLQLSNEMRDVTHRLRPPMLEQLGLVAALRSLVAEFSAQHPQVTIKESYEYPDAKHQDAGGEVELALYRICQECLNNIAKHAQAPAVIVRLEKKDSRLVLNMGDQGVGFDPRSKKSADKKSHQGLGLLGIRERVADLGGTFNLSTDIQRGTFITVELPLDSEVGV